MEQHPNERRERRREAARMADLSTVGLVFPVAVVIGYFGGKTVGGWLGSEQGGALAGVLVGVVSGFYNLVKVALRLQRQDREEQALPRDDPARPPRSDNRPGSLP